MNKTEISLINIIEKSFQKDNYPLAKSIAEEFVKKEAFPVDKIKELVADSFQICLSRKFQDVSGYFSDGAEKYFLDNLTDTYEKIIKNYIENDITLNKRINKSLKKILEQINIETTLFNIFNNKKDLMLELMLKNMLKDK